MKENARDAIRNTRLHYNRIGIKKIAQRQVRCSSKIQYTAPVVHMLDKDTKVDKSSKMTKTGNTHSPSRSNANDARLNMA